MVENLVVDNRGEEASGLWRDSEEGGITRSTFPALVSSHAEALAVQWLRAADYSLSPLNPGVYDLPENLSTSHRSPAEGPISMP